MTPLNRRYTLEALIAASILAILLMLMIPKFFSAQKYGPIGPDDCDCFDNKWTWEEGILQQNTYESGRSANLLFKQSFNSMELSFKVWIPQGGDDGLRIIFGTSPSANDRYVRIYDHLPVLLTTQVWHEVRFTLLPDSKTTNIYVDGKRVLHHTLNKPSKDQIGLELFETKGKFKDIKISPFSAE